MQAQPMGFQVFVLGCTVISHSSHRFWDPACLCSALCYTSMATKQAMQTCGAPLSPPDGPGAHHASCNSNWDLMLKTGSSSHPGNCSWLSHVGYLLASTMDVKPEQIWEGALDLCMQHGAGRTTASWVYQMFLLGTSKCRLPPSLALLWQETNLH